MQKGYCPSSQLERGEGVCIPQVIQLHLQVKCGCKFPSNANWCISDAACDMRNISCWSDAVKYPVLNDLVCGCLLCCLTEQWLLVPMNRALCGTACVCHFASCRGGSASCEKAGPMTCMQLKMWGTCDMLLSCQPMEQVDLVALYYTICVWFV